MSFKIGSPNFFFIPLSPFHLVIFSVLTKTCACVCLLFLSQENATIVILCTGIAVGNNNFPCQLAEEMAVSFYSTPINTSRSEGNLFLWKRPAACTEGQACCSQAAVSNWSECVQQNTVQDVRTTPECHRKPIIFGNVYLGTQNRAKIWKNKIKLSAPSWILLVFACLSE